MIVNQQRRYDDYMSRQRYLEMVLKEKIRATVERVYGMSATACLNQQGLSTYWSLDVVKGSCVIKQLDGPLTVIWAQLEQGK